MKKSIRYTKKCCKDEHKLIKLDKDQRKGVDNTLPPAQFATEIPAAYIVMQHCFIPSIEKDRPVSHAPPLRIRIHILHCTFRI